MLKNGEEATNRVARERVFQFLQIPEAIINIKYPNYPDDDGVLINRFSFALSNLYKAGAIERPKRGVYKITEIGQSLLQEYGSDLTAKILEEQPEYQ